MRGFVAAFSLVFGLAVIVQANPPIYNVTKVIRGTDLWGGSNPLPIRATGLNAHGQVCGYFTVPAIGGDGANGTVVAFTLDAAGNPVNLSQPLSAENSVPTCVNDAGTVAGVCWYDNTHAYQLGFVWQNGAATTFASPTGGNIDAVTAVNRYGQAVGTYFNGSSPYQRAFRWDGTTCTDLGDLGDPAHSFVWPVGLTDDGLVAGTLYTEDPSGGPAVATAFQWQDAALSALDADGRFAATVATGQDIQGNVVGTDTFIVRGLPQFRPGDPPSPHPAPGAFFWSQAGFTDLGDLGGAARCPSASISTTR